MAHSATQTSRFLSLVLRHRPEEIDITLNEQGWTPVDGLLLALEQHGLSLSSAELADIVTTNDKQRFALSEDKQYIRANQGHSVDVDLGLVAEKPPNILYHGTVDKFLKSIQRQGLLPGKRHHVHLHEQIDTARKVGQRRGAPIVLKIDARAMTRDQFSFYVSNNGVWLTDRVPPTYLELHSNSGRKRES